MNVKELRAAKKKPRESGMTRAALRELERRARAGESIAGAFSLRTGKPLELKNGRL